MIFKHIFIVYCDKHSDYFMYNWIATYSAYGWSERGNTGDTVANDGSRLRKGLLNKGNAASPVWTDTAYRSKPHEAFMERPGFVLKVHRKKPHSKPMPQHILVPNAGKSASIRVSGMSFAG